MSGRRDPRTGGVIIAHADSEEDISAIIAEDSFHQNDIADYGVINFQPSMTSDELAMYREDLNL